MNELIDPDHLQRGSSVSPFLPSTQIQYAWDSTSLGLLKTCPKLYWYTMIEGYQGRGESPHLRFGSEYHTALQDYDMKRALGTSHDEALHDVVEELLIRTADYAPDPDTKAGKYKSKANLVELVVYYLEAHQNDSATTYFLPDGKPAVELSFRFELEWGPKHSFNEGGSINDAAGGQMDYVEPHFHQPYILSGHLDKVVNWSGGLFVKDYKTSVSTLGPYYFAQYDMSNQMTLYTLAGQIVLSTPIRGVLIDAAQIKLEDHPSFVRGITYRTKAQLAEWQADLHYWFSLAESFATQGHWPMNDTACDKFGGCKFRGVCSRAPQVRKHFLKSDFIKLAPEDRWNPLRSR